MLKTAAAKRKEREKALDLAVAKARVNLGLNYDYEVAERLDLTADAYCTRKRAGSFRQFGFEEATKMADRLGFTADDVLAIFGFPVGGAAR